jgi:hypothetical protein
MGVEDDLLFTLSAIFHPLSLSECYLSGWLSAVGDITLGREIPLPLPRFKSIEPPQLTENTTPRVGKTRALTKRVRGF